MTPLITLVVIASAIWMFFDASRLGYDKRDLQGLAAMGPLGWFFSGLLLWIVAFPLYLVYRGKLKAAGERRRVGLAGSSETFPLTEEQVAQGAATLAALRDAGKISDEVCRAQQAQLIARQR